MAKAGHRFELILSVANLDAAAWLWTAITADAPRFVEHDGRRELHGVAGDVRLCLRAAADVQDRAVQSIALGVGVESLPDLLSAAAQAGFACHALDGGDHAVTVAPGLVVHLRPQPEPSSLPPGPPPGRLVRRPPRAEAPRAKRPDRKKPDTTRAAPESSARAPRRIVRPRGQVRKVGKK